MQHNKKKALTFIFYLLHFIDNNLFAVETAVVVLDDAEKQIEKQLPFEQLGGEYYSISVFINKLNIA